MKLNQHDSTRHRHGGSRPLLLVAVAVFVLSLIGVFWLTGSGGSEGDVVLDEIHTVERGGFPVSFPASGELSSSEFVEIRNPLDTVGVVKSIVDEGTTVQEGDTLIQFNQESLEDAIEKLEDQLTDAENRVVDVAPAAAPAAVESEFPGAPPGVVDVEVVEAPAREPVKAKVSGKSALGKKGKKSR